MDVQRAQRDRAVEDAATAFFAAWDERTAAERRACDAVHDLRRIGLGVRQVAALLELPVSEVRRLTLETTTARVAATLAEPVERDDVAGAGGGAELLDVDPAPVDAAAATLARGMPALVGERAPALTDAGASTGWGVPS